MSNPDSCKVSCAWALAWPGLAWPGLSCELGSVRSATDLKTHFLGSCSSLLFVPYQSDRLSCEFDNGEKQASL